MICRGATIGVFIGCALLGFALFRYQLYRVRHRPEDLDEVQEALLGMGTMQSVDKAHIGFTLQFNRRRLSFDALNEEQASRVEEAVSYVWREHVSTEACARVDVPTRGCIIDKCMYTS